MLTDIIYFGMLARLSACYGRVDFIALLCSVFLQRVFQASRQQRTNNTPESKSKFKFASQIGIRKRKETRFRSRPLIIQSKYNGFLDRCRNTQRACNAKSISESHFANFTYLAETISALAILILVARLRAAESIKLKECGIVV